VPLSDDERQILRQIEQNLRTDERFAQAVSSKGLYRHSARTTWWAVVGIVVSLALVIIVSFSAGVLRVLGDVGLRSSRRATASGDVKSRHA